PTVAILANAVDMSHNPLVLVSGRPRPGSARFSPARPPSPGNPLPSRFASGGAFPCAQRREWPPAAGTWIAYPPTRYECAPPKERRKGDRVVIERLSASQVRAVQDPDLLPCRFSDEMPPLEGIIGQDRA